MMTESGSITVSRTGTPVADGRSTGHNLFVEGLLEFLQLAVQQSLTLTLTSMESEKTR